MIRKGDKIGPYTLLEKLGRGGFGVVWLAEKRSALAVTQVALKMPNDDDIDLDAVRREAAVWIQASGHPNVLSFIDADIYDEQVVIVSEYAPDGSLAAFLKNNEGKAANTGEAIELTSGILSGLAHLHSRKIIHRDLKPANILLQGKTPRLVDFGLARVMKSTSNSHTVSGTYAYMPPETFEGNRSEQTDIWSVGVMLYELLTGRLPYQQENDAALIAAILQGKPEPLPDSINSSLRAVIERAMEKDLNKRFKTAAEMQNALSAATRFVYINDMPVVKTEVLTSPAEDILNADRQSQPTVSFNDEESPYKTRLVKQPETVAAPEELITKEMTPGEHQGVSANQLSQNTLAVEQGSDLEIKPEPLKVDSQNKSIDSTAKIVSGRKPSHGIGLYIGLAALILALILVVGFYLSQSVRKLTSSGSDVLTTLSKEDVELLAADFPPQTLKQLADSKEQRQDFIKQLKEILAMAAEAKASGIADRPEMKSQLALTRSSTLMQAYLTKIKNADAITKEEIDSYLKKPGTEERFKTFLEEAKKSGQTPEGEMKGEQLTQLKEQWAKVYIGEEKAIKAGLDKEHKTQLQLSIQEALTLARKFNEEYTEKNKDTLTANDDDINKWLAAHPEYNAKTKRAKAEDLLKRARSGEDIVKLANENTEDPGNKGTNGELNGGYYEFGRGVMDKNFEAAAFALEPGDISGIVETPYGYHIIKLEGKETKKGKDGKDEEQVKVRHILISTMVKDESNPTGPGLPLKEKARQEVEKEKRVKFVDALAIKHSITLPDDFTVVAPPITDQLPDMSSTPQQKGGK